MRYARRNLSNICGKSNRFKARAHRALRATCIALISLPVQEDVRIMQHDLECTRSNLTEQAVSTPFTRVPEGTVCLRHAIVPYCSSHFLVCTCMFVCVDMHTKIYKELNFVVLHHQWRTIVNCCHCLLILLSASACKAGNHRRETAHRKRNDGEGHQAGCRPEEIEAGKFSKTHTCVGT